MKQFILFTGATSSYNTAGAAWGLVQMYSDHLPAIGASAWRILDRRAQNARMTQEVI